jgi:asparagine synthase (glutamine-hydrolysing)
MKELRPGTTILVKENGIHENRYWNLKAAPHTEDPEETVVAVRSLLLNAVAEHLVADVPTCVLLSGGLDSSAIAALTAETLAQGDTVRTFALDLIGDGLFTPDPLRDTADPPFADRVARHLRSDHKVVSLDYRAILNPNVRQITVGARDSPGLGDMDQSLYLLFNTIHSHASVALSGESADEVFGGYQQFDRDAALSPTFPWMDRGNPGAAALSLMPPDLVEKLAMKEYLDDTYSEAVMHVPRHDEDTDTDRQMRERSYLYIAHFLPLLLDRKDRMSMAASIEIRVPFCDHRLIEYVFNVPWSIKTIDGREKGLLRRSVEDLLPNEVLHRKKSVYPCLHGLDYLTALQEQVRSVVDSPNHRLFELFERRAVAATVSTPPDQLRTKHRLAFEYMLEVGAWLQLRNPSFVMA